MTYQEGMGGLTPHPTHFAPGKETWYPVCRRLGGPQGWSGQVHKILPPAGFDPQTIQPVKGLNKITVFKTWYMVFESL
jgi:hypothetical protein